MSDNNNIQKFLLTIGEQIRWKRARKPLLYELESHILDRRDALICEGMDESEAERQAIAEMGSAEVIGTELDRVHRPKPNWLLIAGVCTLLAAGILLVWLIGGKSEHFSHMLLYGGIGVIFLIIGYFFDYTLLFKYSVPIFAALCGACLVLPFFGGAFLSAATQLCYVLPIAFAGFIYSLESPLKPYIISCTAMLLIPISLLSVNPGSTLIYIFIICSILLIYSAAKGLISPNKLKAYLPVISVFIPFTLLSSYAFSRNDSLWMRFAKGAFSPESDPYAGGWVTLRVRELINTSVFIGSGETSEFSQKFISSPDFSLKEYTLAVASHKFGSIVFVAVIALLAVIIAAVVISSNRPHCTIARLTILSIGLSFALRISAYIACNLGFPLISFDGIPFFSFNGKLLILDMFVVGILLSVFRTESIARDNQPFPHKLRHS